MAYKEFNSCTKCGKPLEDAVPDQPQRRYKDFPQKKGAFVLVIQSGYNMGIDEPPTGIILCNVCGNELFNANPWMKDWIGLYSGNVTWRM